MKKNLMKALAFAVSAIMLSGTVCNAAEAAMHVSAPAAELAAWTVPADETERNNLITALNGVDDGAGNIVKSTDLGNGFSVHQAVGTWDIYNSAYLRCENSSANYVTPVVVKSNDEVSGLDNPFEIDVAYTIYTAFEVVVGKCTEFGDAENDYYKLMSKTVSTVSIGGVSIGNNQIVLSRVKGDTTVSSDPFYQWGTTVAKLKYDGSKLSLSTATAESAGNEWCELDITDPVTEGRVYLRAKGKTFYLKNFSLTKLAGSSPVENFYVGLENFTAADVSKENLADAGWTMTAAKDNMESVDGQIIATNGNLNLSYESDFSGDYTIEAKIYKAMNGCYLKFGYVDASNYYVLTSKYMPVGQYYNATTQTVETVNKDTYKPVDEHNFYFMKVSDGVAYLINSASLAWAGVTKTVSINMKENEDGSETITVNAPVAFTYTDVAGDADGAPITKGKFYYQGVSDNKSKIDYVRIYPTGNKKDISFDLYVDGTKAEGNTLSKGKVEISMPVKYAGTRNKILVALYENHRMTDVKVFEASDFYTEDKLEVFDTTNCSDDAEVSVMMWNSLDEIKPIISKIPVMSVQ